MPPLAEAARVDPRLLRTTALPFKVQGKDKDKVKDKGKGSPALLRHQRQTTSPIRLLIQPQLVLSHP
jgi:hypothetical protein